MKTQVSPLCDLNELQAVAYYMELESVGMQINAAIEHFLQAARVLSDPALREMELAEAGKDIPKRPSTDYTTRSYLSGLLTGVLMQTNLISEMVTDIQALCSSISPNCRVPETVN